jgi:hypothetical protein
MEMYLADIASQVVDSRRVGAIIHFLNLFSTSWQAAEPSFQSTVGQRQRSMERGNDLLILSCCSWVPLDASIVLLGKKLWNS